MVDQPGLTVTPFVPLPAPYLDFAIVSFAIDRGEVDVEDVAGELSAHGLGTLVVRHPTGDFLIVTPHVDRTGEVDGLRYGVSGLCMTAERMLVPWETPTAEEFAAIDPACGQYTSFAIRDGLAKVDTDAFGYGVTYASGHGKMAIASNRLHLHVVVMRALRISVELDAVAVTASLFTDHGFFSQQSALSRTLVAGVTRVPVDCNVTLGAVTGRCQLRQEDLLDVSYELDAGAYQRLVDQGSERLKHNVSVALDAGAFDNVLLEMSGGKDTRLVLGAAMHTSGWADRVQLKTRGKLGDGDVAVASGVASLFGLSFFRGSPVERFPLTIRDNIDFWRSYYFGEYHRFAGEAWSVKGANRSDLAIGGANGEVLRSFWSDVVQRDIADGGSVDAFARRFVERVAITDAFDHGAVQAVGDALADELHAGYGPTLDGFIEDHYLRHRNRTHCGMRGYSAMNEQLIWYPLMAPELFTASRSVPFEVRRSGQLVHDVLVRLNPLLVDIPFDGADPFSAVDRSRVPAQWQRRLQLALDPSTEAWQEATGEEARTQQARRSGRPAAMVWSRFPSEMADEFASSLDLLVAHGALSDVARDGLARRFQAMQGTSVRAAYQLASRVFAIADVIS